MRWLLLAFTLWSTPALALTDPRQGLWVELGAGGLLDTGSPVAFAPSWGLSMGVWFGQYDEDFAIGRYGGIGITLRQAWLRGELVTLPSLELRKGVDVIVVGYHGFLHVGPQITDNGVGLEGLLGVGAKYRFKPHWGVGVRLGAGAAWADERVTARAEARLTLCWAASFKKKSLADPPVDEDF